MTEEGGNRMIITDEAKTVLLDMFHKYHAQNIRIYFAGYG